MDTQINNIVDKLAEKLGIAVTELTPLAHTVIAETRMEGVLYICCGILLSSLIICVWRIIYKLPLEKESDREGAKIASSIACSIALFLTALLTFVGSGSSLVAPTKTVIKEMLL